MILPKSRALTLIFVLIILLFSNCSESQNGLESSVSEDKAAEEIFNSGEKEIKILDFERYKVGEGI